MGANNSRFAPDVQDQIDAYYPKEDSRGWSYYNYFVGGLDEEYQRFKGFWVAMHIAVVCFVIINFCFAVVWRVQDHSWAYHTLFDYNTAFLTDQGVVAPAQVAQQINLAHDQSAYVASFLLTLATIMFGIEIVAVLMAMLGAWMRDGFGLYLFTLGFRTLFSSVGLIDTSIWVGIVGLCTDWVMWWILASIYGVRDIWTLYLLVVVALGRGMCVVAAEQENSITKAEEIDDPEREYRARSTRFVSRVASMVLTILGQVYLMLYMIKFPADPRPTYYLALGILVFILELAQYLVWPAIRFILRYKWNADQVYVLAPWDPYTYDMCLWLFQVLRYALVLYCVRFGDTGHVFVPRWGFAL